MKTLGFAALLASAVGFATMAQAAHCGALSRAFDEIRKISAKVDKADAREDMEAACELQGQEVALIRRTLENTRTECFHGGKKAFETAFLASQALEELYCSWDEEYFDEDDF